MEKKFQQIEAAVFAQLASDNSGHGMDHIKRVKNLALQFACDTAADKAIVTLAALLHDVDDYKLVGKKKAAQLTNARQIMDSAKVAPAVSEQVLEIIRSMGYSKALMGIRPQSLEGRIVSDADLCDAIGASGILRAYQYSLSQGNPFFDRDIWPIDNISFTQYTSVRQDTTVCHFFEKLLRVRDLVTTAPGKQEAASRHQFMVTFLTQYFAEVDAPEWQNYLDEFCGH